MKMSPSKQEWAEAEESQRRWALEASQLPVRLSESLRRKNIPDLGPMSR